MDYDMSNVNKIVIDLSTWNMARKCIIGFMFSFVIGNVSYENKNGGK
jgi:hypothetical protein